MEPWPDFVALIVFGFLGLGITWVTAYAVLAKERSHEWDHFGTFLVWLVGGFIVLFGIGMWLTTHRQLYWLHRACDRIPHARMVTEGEDFCLVPLGDGQYIELRDASLLSPEVWP